MRLVSRNGNAFKSFPSLCEGLARDLNGHRCILDGEIVFLDSEGKPRFVDLLFRRAEPAFYAFDILWDEHARSDDDEEMRRFRNGENTRYLPLIDRKLRLRRVVPKGANVSSTVTRSRMKVKVCSGSLASMILKALSRSGSSTRTCRSTPVG